MRFQMLAEIWPLTFAFYLSPSQMQTKWTEGLLDILANKILYGQHNLRVENPDPR